MVDAANLLRESDAQELSSLIRSVRDAGGPQLTVLTVPSLDGVPIEVASIRVVEAWKLGDKKRDDGVLLMVALAERKLRIEVGQGLEGDLTDVQSKRIIDDIVVPYFRAKEPSAGIAAGVYAILQAVYPQGLVGKEPTRLHRSRDRGEMDMKRFIFMMVLFGFFVAVFVLRFGGKGRRGHGLVGGASSWNSWGSSSGGWGGRSGGGGWGGGGGGFSGGGASGGW